MININCDTGEGLNNEAEIMPFIDSANIACGFHAGDADTMKRVIELCLLHKVNIGAHPSFPDRENFGRTAMQLTDEEVYDLVAEQLHLINSIAKDQGASLLHVKPHGALYNMAAADAELSRTIARAVRDFDDELVFYGLSGSVMIREAEACGLKTANEVFADRSYQPDGSLTPRSSPGALLTTIEDVMLQVNTIIKENKVRALNGKMIDIKADTICIHGDGPNAIEFAKAIHRLVHAH